MSISNKINTYPINSASVDESLLSNRKGIERLGQKMVITYINGIRTSKDKLEGTANAISMRHSMLPVYYINEISEGIYKDVKKSVELMLGQKNPSVTQLVKLWRSLFAKAGGLLNNDFTIIHYAHSRGGLVTAEALKEMHSAEKARIEIILLGSPAIIKDPSIKKCIHLRSSSDLIPLVNPSRWGNALPDEYIIESQNPERLIDHDVTNTTYMGAIAVIGAKVIKKL